MIAGILIVTGASRDIGAGTARLAAGRGYAVCVNYPEDRETAEGVVREEVERRLGRPAALVNNAATLERQMRLEEIAARMSTPGRRRFFCCFRIRRPM